MARRLITIRIDPDIAALIDERAGTLGMTRTDFLTDAAVVRAHANYRGVLLGDPCAYCGNKASAIDHITPRARGGDDGWGNLAAACQSCNSRKGARTLLFALIGGEPTRAPVMRNPPLLALPSNPALHPVAVAAYEAKVAEWDLRSAIVEAFNDRDGYTVDDIAEAAGLSRPRIYQLVNEAKREAERERTP